MTPLDHPLRCGLIGANLGQSRFSQALDLMCQAEGLRLSFDLIDSAKQPELQLDTVLKSCMSQGWSGLSVTHPFKTAAADWLGAHGDNSLQRLGASNLITFQDGAVHGHNTDYSGFLSAWRAVMGQRRPGRVAMAGAGGVARALGQALVDLGADEIILWDVDMTRAQELAQALGPTAHVIPADDMLAALSNADGLINATPLGMHAYPGSAFPQPLPHPPHWVFDAVYTPVETPFIQAARGQGATIITGFDLFRHMAVRSFQAYTGITPDEATTLVLLEKLKPQEN